MPILYLCIQINMYLLNIHLGITAVQCISITQYKYTYHFLQVAIYQSVSA